MTSAVDKDITYAPRLQSIYTGTPGNWVLSSQSAHATRRNYIRKPASVHTPCLNGWRNPRVRDSAYKDHQWRMIDCVIEKRNNVGGTWSKTEGVFTAIAPPEPVRSRLPAAAKAQMEINALNKLRDGAVNLGVSFGERKEVAGMMLSNFGKIAKAYREFRRGHFRNAARELGLGWRDAPNRWLEYQYGWKPLLGDVYKATERLNEADRKNNSRTYYHVTEELKWEDKPKVLTTVNSGVALITESHVRVDAKIRFDFSPDPDMALFRELDEWGITNPMLIAWELVPFSFVVDWALPIGDYLNALTASKPFNFKGGSFSEYGRTDYEHKLKGVSSASFTVRTCFGRGRGWALGFQRYLYAGFPFPDISAIAHSKYRNATSQTIATRTANAISLLANAVR